MPQNKLPKFEDWTPPWGEDDEDFNAETAKKLIYNLTSDKEKSAEKVSAAKAEVTTVQEELATVKSELADVQSKGNEAEVGKLQTKVKELEASLKSAERTNILLTVADEKGIPLSQANRLQGETEEEIAEDADAFLQSFGARGESQDPDGDDPDEGGITRTPRRASTPLGGREAGDGSDSGPIDISSIPRLI